jgi:colanic acid/amylovoran biosynthesis protein
MIIEIRQAGFVNKGAELMLHAVIQKLRERYPDAKLTMAPDYGGADDTFEKMQELKLYPKAWFFRKGFDFGRLALFIPKKLLRQYGLIVTKEIDVVIDAAGFAYSDQWGVSVSAELSSSSAVWKKNGTKLILLPQALGPYETPRIKKHVKSWVGNADLIFAREKDSYKYLTDLVDEQSKIKMCSDFTNLVKGTLPKDYESSSKRIALVPNYRMIDKTSGSESEAYLPFMIRCAQYLVSKGKKPFILVHEGKNDMILAESISQTAGGIPILKETNPLHIKGILGTCDATIGSRFHGLVSALSQSVPSLATGWSHKYARLFEDYGFLDGIVSVHDDEEELHRKIDMLINPETSSPLKQKLNEKSIQLKAASEEMWDLVFTEIDQAKR